MRRTLEITTAVGCTVGCSYCPQRTFVRAQRFVSELRLLTLETFDRCLSSVPSDVEVNFSGYAEPWQNPDATTMVERARALGHPSNIFSTLVGLALGDVDRLSRVPLAKFRVHLPDDGSRMHVRVDAAYLAVLAAVVQLPTRVELVCIGEPHPEVLRVVRRERIPVELVSRAGNVDGAIVRAPASKTGALRCAEERLYRNVLLPNGDVTLCCADYGRRHVLGNLLTESYAELFTGAVFRAVVERMAGAPGDLLCRTCEHARAVPVQMPQ